jgi:hypothetical protein
MFLESGSMGLTLLHTINVFTVDTVKISAVRPTQDTKIKQGLYPCSLTINYFIKNNKLIHFY